jgi:hypothetical protein
MASFAKSSGDIGIRGCADLGKPPFKHACNTVFLPVLPRGIHNPAARLRLPQINSPARITAISRHQTAPCPETAIL